MARLFKPRMLALAVLAALASRAHAEPAAAPARAEVLHWWTSGGESAAARTLADAFRAAGGTWIDTAVAGSEQARAVAVSRVAGGNPPTAALFNASRQFRDLVDQGQLTALDDVARQGGWDRVMPPAILDAVRVNGHVYAAPVDIHMTAWIWYSKAAFKKAGIAAEPRSVEELFQALDRLRAAGLIPLAHGGQPWQDSIVFRAVLASVGGRDLYLRVFRDRDPRAIESPEFRQVLLTFRRLHGYVDAGSPGRHWNDATGLLVAGRAGVQIMGDWVRAEFSAARQRAGVDYGCLPGLGEHAPYVIQADAFVFPKNRDAATARTQALLATTVTSPAVQVSFSSRKGSLPVRSDVELPSPDPCVALAAALMRDRARQLPNDEMFLTPDQAGAMADVLTAYWNRDMPVETVQKKVVAALRDDL